MTAIFCNSPEKSNFFFFPLPLATCGLHLAQGGRGEVQDLLLVPKGLQFCSGGEKGPGGAVYFPVVGVTSLLQATSGV